MTDFIEIKQSEEKKWCNFCRTDSIIEVCFHFYYKSQPMPLCQKCLNTLRSSFGALNILVQTGVDTK